MFAQHKSNQVVIDTWVCSNQVCKYVGFAVIKYPDTWGLQ
jgi:hypothetical protein